MASYTWRNQVTSQLGLTNFWSTESLKTLIAGQGAVRHLPWLPWFQNVSPRCIAPSHPNDGTFIPTLLPYYEYGKLVWIIRGPYKFHGFGLRNCMADPTSRTGPKELARNTLASLQVCTKHLMRTPAISQSLSKHSATIADFRSTFPRNGLGEDLRESPILHRQKANPSWRFSIENSMRTSENCELFLLHWHMRHAPNLRSPVTLSAAGPKKLHLRQRGRTTRT